MYFKIFFSKIWSCNCKMHFLSSINLRKCTKSGNILKEFCKTFSMKWGYGQAWPFELWSKWKSIWFGLCRLALHQLCGEIPFALSEVSSALWQAPINQPERKNDDRSSEKSVEPHWLRHKRIGGSYTLHVQLGLGWDVFQNGWDGSQPLRRFVPPPPHHHH